MLSLLSQSISNASFGIYFPRFTGTIYEILSAPVSYWEIVIAYVGAAASKSILLGVIILATAGLFVPLHILHPFWMVLFLVLTAVTFSLFGFVIGIWADSFEAAARAALDHHAAHVPRRQLLLGRHAAARVARRHAVQPDRLPGQRLPLVVLRIADVHVGVSLGATSLFLVILLAIVAWMFRTGYKLKN